MYIVYDLRLATNVTTDKDIEVFRGDDFDVVQDFIAFNYNDDELEFLIIKQV